MELISDYMRNEANRHMLNALTQKTFGIDFENWVTKGYFEGDYIPYSYIEDGKMISNVSANRMHFMQNGVERNYIQIGTVMTDSDYRKQGLAGKLLQHVIKVYEQECDGIYLFGDLSAVGFYQKMGFEILNQYRYHVKEVYCNSTSKGEAFVPIKSLGEDMPRKYMDAVRTSSLHSAFEQLNKFGLQMFYTADFENVYYAKDIDCFIVIEQEDCTVLQSVLCNEKVSLEDVLSRMEIVNNRCVLGFVPLVEEQYICDCEIYDGEEDYRLFYRGSKLASVEHDKLYFPDLSHA